ncbi:MAG: DUF11 domain-containing protein [Phycisphaerae bacterium]|nr:DUF11 domain-containing protein [Phycisphaerae bacterium]
MSRNRTIAYVASLAALALATGGCRCAQWQRHWHNKEVAPEVANKCFWSKDCKPLEAEPEPQPVPAAAPATECGLYISAQTYPESQAVRLEKNMPDAVQIDSEFDYTITVINVSDATVENVTVTERVGQNFEYARSEPSAEQQDDRLVWSLGAINAGQSQSIRVTGRATDMDCIRQCATVTYDVPTCGFVRVINPQLSVALTAPDSVLRCEDIPLTYTVTNEGTGEAEDVVILSELPDGLQTTEGQAQVEMHIGSLPAGASQEYTVMARAQNTGEFGTTADSRAAGDLSARSDEVTVTVTEPVLEIDYTAPSEQYLGRPVQSTIKVRNVGSGPAMNTVVEADVPAEASDVSPSGDGRVMGSRVVWDLATIAPDESREMTLLYTAERGDSYTSTATVSATCADAKTAQVNTTVAGLAAILMEVIDTADPVEVGQEESYEVTVTNQGTAPDSNIRITAELESSMEYVSSSGPTDIAEQNGTVTFQPLQELQPGESVTWTIRVRAVSAADARFKVTMNSDQLGRDVEKTEATQFYTTQ